MSDEPVYLPDAIVQAWAVHGTSGTGQGGESIAMVLLTLEFQVSPEHSARQTFVLHKDDAALLRRDLKQPPDIDLTQLATQASEEDTND